MRISILAGGSRGDTQPFVALGVALKRAGCDVRVTAHENFEEFVEGFGLEFHPLGGDVSRVVGDDRVRRAMQADSPLKMLRSFRTLKALAYDMQKDHYAACQGADTIVYHPGASIGYFAAQALGVPSVLAAPFPMTPTREYPALLFYDSVRLGRQANLLTHRIFERTMWLTASSPVKRFWNEVFGETPKDFSSPFSRQRSASHPTVVSCSNHVFPTPDDWPEHVHNTGYWFLDEEAGWEPPADLLDFLKAGTPPVYVGFGSMNDPEKSTRTTELMIEALQRSGQRGVLATGWGGMAKIDDIPEGVYVLGGAPHAWLFPRMSTVVHHGGAGTTAAGLRAGVPSIVIPHAKGSSMINFLFSWFDSVIPIPMKLMPYQPNLSKLLITHLHTSWIRLRIQRRLNPKARPGSGTPNQRHDHLMTHQRATPPVHGDETEHPMLNLVPLARPRRVMTHAHLQAGGVRETLQRYLPQATTTAVTPTTISHHQQLLGSGVRPLAQLFIPAE